MSGSSAKKSRKLQLNQSPQKSRSTAADSGNKRIYNGAD